MRLSYGIALLGLLLGAGAGSLSAQGSDALYARFNAVTGWEIRTYDLDPGIGTKSVTQWNVPIVAVAPLGSKASIDLTTHYASGTVDTYAGTSETFSGLTDTQLRLLYTASRDRLVGSILFNLPTGNHTLTPEQFTVAGAVGSNYLSFPVANSGTAFGVTGGLAYAHHSGSWNFGLSGSVRYLGSYLPFSGDTLSYSPGIEGRVRAGVDRLLGSKSRALLGVTVSTFSTDTYSGSNALVAGSYSPGTRVIGDFTWLRVMGRSTLSIVAWDLYRMAGSSSSGSNLATKENVLNGELRWTYSASSRVQFEPMVAVRQWNPADYLGGRLESGGLTLRVGLSDRVSLAATGRYDTGWIFDQATGRADLTGYGASLFLRYSQ